MILPIYQVRQRYPGVPMVACSGGFDPLHVGHVRYLTDAAKLADLCVVVVNSDRFLCRKSGSKGFAFMSLEDRMEIISALLYVDVVTTWDAGGDDLTVCGALTILRPQIFAKGGDRTGPENIPEWGICQEIGCKVSVGIGGSKVRSSSELVKRGNI